MDSLEQINKTGSAKKLLTIAPYTFLPPSSGGRRAIYYLYQHIGKKLQLTCVSTADNETGKEPLQFVLRQDLGRGLFRYLNPLHYFKLKALVKKQAFEAIMIEHPYMGWLGWWLKLTMGIPLVVRSHNIEARRFKELGKWWWRVLADYERWVHRKADHSFFITQEDADYAISKYAIKAEKTTVITYGLDTAGSITPEQKQAVVARYKQQHQIPAEKTLLFFNGIFGYPPNDEALILLLEQIYPALLQMDPNFYLIICGANIPDQYQHIKDNSKSVMGFVPDIGELFRVAEIFLNPIWLGGGIKTKLVEALAGGASAVSFQSGATGISPFLLANKLKIVPDKEIDSFALAVIEARSTIYKQIPDAFYTHFDWQQIAGKAVRAIDNL